MTTAKRVTQKAYEQRTKHAAQQKYNKNNIQRVVVNLNQKTDAAIIAHIEKQPNKQGYLKSLVKKDMRKRYFKINKPMTPYQKALIDYAHKHNKR